MRNKHIPRGLLDWAFTMGRWKGLHGGHVDFSEAIRTVNWRISRPIRKYTKKPNYGLYGP